MDDRQIMDLYNQWLDLAEIDKGDLSFYEYCRLRALK